MQRGESSRALRVAVLVVVALLVGAGWSRQTGVVEAQKSVDPTLQSNPDPSLPSAADPGLPSNDIRGLPPSPMSEQMKQARTKMFNDERHKRLEDDVSKLQALTNELKSDVDKANKDELSLEVMRKAAEIEKLAHDVQSRMKS